MPTHLKLLFSVSLIFSVWGCASAPDRQPRKADSLVILIGGPSEGTDRDIFSARDLFTAGKKAHQESNFDDCVRIYDQLIQYFADSKYATTGHFNRGLCLQKLKNYSEAAKDFGVYSEKVRSKSNRRDGLVRMGFNLVHDRQYRKALDLYDALLEDPTLGGFIRAECLLRRGMAKAGLSNPSGADVDYERSLYENSQANQDLIKGNALTAEVLFRRGELYGGLMSKIKFKLPKERMQGDLRKKMRLFRKSQRSYTESINIQNPYWSIAAGTRAGELFELFHQALTDAEIPKAFTQEMKDYYHAEMNRQILPLLAESIEIYELNLAMSMRLGINNEWVEQTEAKLKELLRLYEEKKKRLNDHPTIEDAEESPSNSNGESEKVKSKS